MRSPWRAGTVLLAVLLAGGGLAIAAQPGAGAQQRAGAWQTGGAQPAAHPRYRSVAPAGSRNENLLMAGWTDPKTGYMIRQNMWNCPSDCGAQTLWANSSSDWGVVSDQPKGNTAVLTYPDIQDILTLPSNSPAPLRGFRTIAASFGESSPAAGDYEAAFDMWLNSGNTEVMIWTANHGQRPAGSPVATAVLDGQRWTLWKYPGTSGGFPSGPFTLVLHGNEKAGTVHILLTLDWLMSHRYLPRDSAINDVEYGWEICSTGGRAENFQITKYALTIRT
jgi:Glycosyl hydrolase family 12